jgi:uncharacterized protein (TIGR01777 family)
MKDRIYIKKTEISTCLDKVFAWHEREGAVLRLTPPWIRLKPVSRTGRGLDRGVKIVFEMNFFGIPLRWESEHIEYIKNKLFRDRQVRGPFASWEHTHRFVKLTPSTCMVEDYIAYRLPLGFLSSPFYRLAQSELERIFTYRHNILKLDLESHMPLIQGRKVVVSGASGLIGSALVPFLQTCGYKVLCLVRHKNNLGENEIYWNPYAGEPDLSCAGKIDAVINLNGLDISRGRWTQEHKQRIMDSRIIPTRMLVKAINRLQHAPSVFISASATGYYGDAGNIALTEGSDMGDFFISRLCHHWERAATVDLPDTTRPVQLRTGIVLTPAGGALKRMLPVFRAGAGVRFGHGRQYMSWISMEDLLRAVLHILNENRICGPVNLTAPNPVSNAVFSRTLAAVSGGKLVFPLPESIVKILWGQMGRETLLASARVKPEKLMSTGFSFRHETLMQALREMLGKYRQNR